MSLLRQMIVQGSVSENEAEITANGEFPVRISSVSLGTGAMPVSLNQNTILPVSLSNDSDVFIKGVSTLRAEVSKVNSLHISPFDSSTGSRQIIDQNGAAKVGEAIILAGDVFGTVTPNTLQWDDEFVGSGASTPDDGFQRIETGTTANSEARFQSVKKARFMLSQFNIFHAGLKLNNIADTDCRRRFGAYNPIGTSNGAFFEVDGGAWSINTVKNGVVTSVPQGSWTGNGAADFDATPDLAVYEIIYNAGTIFFFQGANLLHRQAVNTLGETYAASYHFNVGVEVVNSNGNTTDNAIELYAMGIYRLGEERGETISRVVTSDTLMKTGAGYCTQASLSRTGSAGGSGTVTIYDGVDNTGLAMARLDVGGDDIKGVPIKSTFSDGLFIEVSGTGTNSVTIGFE